MFVFDIYLFTSHHSQLMLLFIGFSFTNFLFFRLGFFVLFSFFPLPFSNLYFFLFGIFIFIFLMRLDVPSWLTFFNVLTQPGVVKAHKECFPIVGSMIFFFSNAIRIFWLSMIRFTFFHPCHEWYWWDDENVLLFRYENFYSKTAW